MNPEDLAKMSDEELDDAITKKRKENKKAIDAGDRKEERKTLADLNMLEDERLDRERKKHSADADQGGTVQAASGQKNKNSKEDSSGKGEEEEQEEEDEEDGQEENEEEDGEQESEGESEHKSAQEIADEMQQKKQGSSEDKKEKNTESGKEKTDKSNKQEGKKEEAGSSGKQSSNPGGGGQKLDNAAKNGQQAAESAQKAQQAAETAKKAEQTAETAAKAAKTAKTAKTASILAGTPLGWIILAIVIAIIFLIILIGIISFFVTMPSLVSGKLGEFLNSFWKNVVGFFTVNTAETKVTEEQIIEVADYLNDMGFDLAGYGFLDVKEGGRLTAEKGEKQAVKYKDGDTVVLEKNEDGEITSINSSYLLTYLANDNLTYMIANNEVTILSVFDFFTNILSGGYTRNIVSQNFGQGMIVLDGTGEVGWDEFKYNRLVDVKIDREQKVMIVENQQGFSTKYSTYTYDLDGWTGLYGKPVEFLLSLHLATMAPDFAFDVATNENIETKVHLQFHPITHKVEAFTDPEGNNKVEEGDFGITQETLEGWGVREDTAYKPYITKVEKHWYTNFDFSHCYMLLDEEETKNLIGEQTYLYEREYPSNVYDEFGNQIMATETEEIPIYLIETTTSDFAQIKEPKRTDNSKYIREMLTQTPYYIFDGTGHSEEKELLVDPSTGTLSLDTKSKRFLYALSILENVDTKDAKTILKMLKQLLNDYGAEFDIDDGSLSDSSAEEISEDLEEAVPGFEEGRGGQDVLSPYSGTITSISENSIVIEAGMGVNAVKYEISGFKVDSGLQKGTIVKGDKIGETIAGQSLNIRKKNSVGETTGDVSIGDVLPGSVSANTDATKLAKLTTVSELEKALKNYGGPLGTIAEELLSIQNETGVNALVIASIAITESSGGKNVQAGTNNWTGNMNSNGDLIQYDCVEDCLRATANNLKNNYFSQGSTTLGQIGNKYNPSNPSYGNTLASYINQYFVI